MVRGVTWEGGGVGRRKARTILFLKAAILARRSSADTLLSSAAGASTSAGAGGELEGPGVSSTAAGGEGEAGAGAAGVALAFLRGGMCFRACWRGRRVEGEGQGVLTTGRELAAWGVRLHLNYLSSACPHSFHCSCSCLRPPSLAREPSRLRRHTHPS